MKHLLLLLLSPLAILTATAQPTLEECRTLARENYPEIRRYDLISLTEQYSLSNAARAWIPQVGISAQASWQTDVPTYPAVLSSMLAQQGVSIQGMEKTQYKAAVEINQTVWDGGKSKSEREIARAEAEEQRHSTHVSLYEVEGRVDNMYFGILLLDERIEQMNLTRELLMSNLEKIRSLLRNGAATQSDSDAVEAELITVEQQITQLQASRESYRRMLEIFIGRSLGEGRLHRPHASEPINLTSARPELALFAARTDLLSAQERAVKSSTMPRVGLFAQGYYGYPGMDMFEGMISDNGTWNAMVGVKMSWNIGSLYTRKNNIQKIHVAQRQVDVQRDVFLFNTSLETTEENSEIERLKKALADDERIVALRRSVRMAAESKLDNGVIDTTDLLSKITEESQAATALSTREVELLMTIYRLKHTINQ